MAVNLVSLIMQSVTPSLISKMGGALGLDRDDAQKAVSAGIPAILAGLANAASKPQNQQTLSDAITQQSATLDRAKNAINEGRPGNVAETGNTLLSSLLGGDTLNMLASAVGRFAGIDPNTTKSLLGMLAPLVAGVIGQQQRSEGLGPSGLANLLTSQSSQISAAMPSGFANLLSGTGLLDGIGDGWRRGASAASAAADRVSDFPAHVASNAGHLADTTAQASSRLWPYALAALALLLGLGWYVGSYDRDQTVAEHTLSPSMRASETTGAGVPGQRLTDLAAELTSSVNATRSALQGIADPVSAKAALPKLQQVSAQFDTIGDAMSQLPPNARKGISSVVTRSMPMLNHLFDRVLASPQTAELTKPTIDALRAKLDTLAKS